jgi:outer membrane protein assembly factor BamB
MRWLLSLSLILVSAFVHAQEWPRFRGANGAGVSTTRFPVSWTENDYLWKVPLPGRGNSSPIAWENLVYITASADKTGKRFVLCLDTATGKTTWTREFDDAAYPLHDRNRIATSTPTIDAQRIYLTWATPKHYLVQALDRKTGKDIWSTDLGPYVSQHGFGASPILYEDLLILSNEQDKKGSLHALDCKTGKEVWMITRNSGNATYSAPCIYQPTDQPASIIFTNWQHGITAVEPRTGKVQWERSVFEPKKQERAIASPIIAGDLVIGTCGFVTGQKHFVAVRPSNDGKAREVWRIEKAVAYMPTPIVKGERIYACSELGIFSCIEAATGKLIWQERLADHQFSASPVLAGDAIYCTANDGAVFVLAASDTYQLLGQSQLGEATQSTPAICAGRMIFRTEWHLLAIAASK